MNVESRSTSNVGSGPGATELEDLELPVPKKCIRCGKRFYGSGTGKCMQCRIDRDAQATVVPARERATRNEPSITVRTYQ